jgi:hypothetical protein
MAMSIIHDPALYRLRHALVRATGTVRPAD